MKSGCTPASKSLATSSTRPVYRRSMSGRRPEACLLFFVSYYYYVKSAAKPQVVGPLLCEGILSGGSVAIRDLFSAL